MSLSVIFGIEDGAFTKGSRLSSFLPGPFRPAILCQRQFLSFLLFRGFLFPAELVSFSFLCCYISPKRSMISRHGPIDLQEFFEFVFVWPRPFLPFRRWRLNLEINPFLLGQEWVLKEWHKMMMMVSGKGWMKEGGKEEWRTPELLADNLSWLEQKSIMTTGMEKPKKSQNVCALPLPLLRHPLPSLFGIHCLLVVLPSIIVPPPPSPSSNILPNNYYYWMFSGEWAKNVHKNNSKMTFFWLRSITLNYVNFACILWAIPLFSSFFWWTVPYASLAKYGPRP